MLAYTQYEIWTVLNVQPTIFIEVDVEKQILEGMYMITDNTQSILTW